MVATQVTLQLGIGYLLIFPFWIAAIGWLSGRILGIRLGRWRAALAAFLGWCVGIVTAALVVGGDASSSAGILIPLTIFFGDRSGEP